MDSKEEEATREVYNGFDVDLNAKNPCQVHGFFVEKAGEIFQEDCVVWGQGLGRNSHVAGVDFACESEEKASEDFHFFGQQLFRELAYQGIPTGSVSISPIVLAYGHRDELFVDTESRSEMRGKHVQGRTFSFIYEASKEVAELYVPYSGSYLPHEDEGEDDG